MFKKYAGLFISLLALISICLFSGCSITNHSASIQNEKENPSSQTYSHSSKETNKNTNESSSLKNKIYNSKGIPVLYYHSVRPTEDNELIISPEKLKQQLEFLQSEGYESLSFKEFSNYILNNSPIPPKSFLITFDDGYMDNYTYAFPILKELNMKAVIFCTTFKLDGSYYLSNEAIKEMLDYGIDIQSHTVNHDDLTSINYNDSLSTLKESKSYLENITGSKIYAIAYPFGKFTDNTLKAAKETGYSIGFVTDTGLAKPSDNPLKLNRIYISSSYNIDKFKQIFFDAANK